MEKEINRLKRELGKVKREKQKLEEALKKSNDDKQMYERWYREKCDKNDRLEKRFEELHRMLDFFPKSTTKKKCV